jgi:hypothetical protein
MLTYSCTHELTPWSWVLIQKAPVVQLLENSPLFGTRRFITVFTRARHRSASQTRLIQFVTPHSTSLWYVLLLASHTRLGLPTDLFPSGFPNKTLDAFLFSHTHAIYPETSYSLIYKFSYIWRGVQVMKLLIMQLSPATYYLISLGSKYSPQHPVLEHPRSVFFS